MNKILKILKRTYREKNILRHKKLNLLIQFETVSKEEISAV
ncbi:MAG: hypothetical protein ACXWRZ_03435 [Bdellovibrio sp.]